MDHASRKTESAGGSDLDPDIRHFIRTMAAAMARHAGFECAPHAEQRRWAEEARAPLRQGGPAMLETRELSVPTRHGPVRARIHRPGEGIRPSLVYLHGGGWTLFSIETHDRVMREYAARAGCCVIGIDYALSPEHKFPVPLEQVSDFVSWLESHGPELGIDTHRLAIGGDSAGANLAVATCLLRRDLGSGPQPCGMVLNYGAFSTRSSPEVCRRYGGPEYMLGCEEMNRYWHNYLRSDADAGIRSLARCLRVSRACPPHSSRSPNATCSQSKTSKWRDAFGLPACQQSALSMQVLRTALSRRCQSRPLVPRP